MAKPETVTATGGGSRRPPTKSAATRRRVLESTAKVLIERGYAATRLTDIAAQADLHAGSLYYYFDSKDELVEEVLKYSTQFAQAHVRSAIDALPEGTDAGVRLETALRAHLEASLELGELATAHTRTYLQLPAAMQDRLRPLRRGFSALWTELVEDAVKEGELRKDIDPFALQLLIGTVLEGIPEWHLRPHRTAEEMATMLRTMLLDGIGDGRRRRS